MSGGSGVSTHRCARPDDSQGPGWAGRRDGHGAPIWMCPACRRWWAYGWPGFGGHVEDMAWLPMRDLFTGREPDEFDTLIEAERSSDG